MTLEQQIKQLGFPTNEGIPVVLKTGLGTRQCVLVVSNQHEAFVTLREPGFLQVYRVVGNSLRTHTQISRASSIAEFDALLKLKPRHEFKTTVNFPLRITGSSDSRCRSLIKDFLTINPEPSDAQVHGLAESLGMDYQELEAIMFEMLGQCLDQPVLSASEDELVLEDKLDPRDAGTKTALLHDPGIDPVLITEEQEMLNDMPNFQG